MVRAGKVGFYSAPDRIFGMASDLGATVLVTTPPYAPA